MLPTDKTIPRHVLWADPQKHLARISPNGKHISYLGPHQGELNLWLASSRDWKQAKVITSSSQPIRDAWWSANSEYLLYTHDQQGDENWQLHGYNLLTGKTSVYTPQGSQVRILHSSSKHPEKLLIGLNERDRQFMDVYVLDLNSGESNCIYQNQEYWDFIADDDFKLHLGLKVGTNGIEYIKLDDSSKIIIRGSLHDVFGLYFYPRLRLGLSDSQTFYVCQSLESNTSTLVCVNLNSYETQALMNDPQADIADVLCCPITKKPLAVATYYERKKWHPLDPDVAGDFQYLTGIDDGDIDILSQTQNNQTWLVSFVHDKAPVTYYLYHRKEKLAIYLFNSQEEYKNYQFTKMHPRVIETRDGLKCVSYLSLPRKYDLNEKGIPLEPLPLVLLVHGGPNYRDFWGFNPTHQWLADRGYAVLSMNYRSSTGFGQDHVKKGFGEWGRKIHHDLLDAVAWAIDNKITTKEKVAIMGRSFGGYATLVGLTFTPEVFCCGVDIVGPSNLETMLSNFPPYWRTVREAIIRTLGIRPETQEGKAMLHERSPLFFANNICKPLLIGHGANDVRVLQTESDQMVSAMQANGTPVTYAVFPDEGHQFQHPGNRMAFYALTELFLARILHGRAQGYDAQVHTSMEIKVDDFNLMKSTQL